MDAVNRAIDFVLAQRRDGMWHNFLTRHHGESADWVSSFVGINLRKAGVPEHELDITKDRVRERQRENGGFAYNHKIVPDADSTAFAIRFLGYSPGDADDFLKAHQHPNGGYGTYQEQSIRGYARIPEDMSVEGWCGPIADVTASVLLAMPSDDAVGYLYRTQEADGRWRSYWWTSDVYATAHAVEALKSRAIINTSAYQWLTQNTPDIAFYQALTMMCEPSVELADRLIEKQRTDGSWDTQPILRFPLPSNTEPWSNKDEWRPPREDQNRVFTTAACAAALSCYER